MRVWVCYEAHLSALYLQDGINSHTILEGAVLPKVQGRVIFKNWQIYGLCWEDCEHKNLHINTSPNVTAAITGFLKTSQGGWQFRP